MQVKPRFESYKFLEQYPIVKDDLGNEMCLTLVEAKIKSNMFERVHSVYQYWAIVSKTKEQYNNGAVGYSRDAFWDCEKLDRELIHNSINGIEFKEVECGKHSMFPNRFGIKTRFEFL